MTAIKLQQSQRYLHNHDHHFYPLLVRRALRCRIVRRAKEGALRRMQETTLPSKA